MRVKDEELHQLVRDLRARDVTMKELADHLTETAHAAESAASAVHAVDKEHKEALLEVDRSRTQLLQVVQEVEPFPVAVHRFLEKQPSLCTW